CRPLPRGVVFLEYSENPAEQIVLIAVGPQGKNRIIQLFRRQTQAPTDDSHCGAGLPLLPSKIDIIHSTVNVQKIKGTPDLIMGAGEVLPSHMIKPEIIVYIRVLNGRVTCPTCRLLHFPVSSC